MRVRPVGGMVFDPFGLHMAGVLRQTKRTKNELLNNFETTLHKEAKFKKMLVTCCHFADSITFLGPVARLEFIPSSVSSAVAEPSVNWVTGAKSGDTGKFFSDIEKFLRNSGNKPSLVDRLLSATNSFTDNSGNGYLCPMPDLSMPHGSEYGLQDDITNKVYGGRYSPATYCEESNSPTIPGNPYVGLMAVMFSFKTPFRRGLASYENTNLGYLPPMVFFIPTILPGDPVISADDYKVMLRQPAVYSFTIQNRPEKDSYNEGIMPFGSPFNHQSVPPWGKVPDVMRSLAVELERLWGDHTLYSALNFSTAFTIKKGISPADVNYDWEGDPIGRLSLEPMGLGRRIRGYNRYSSLFELSQASALFQIRSDSEGVRDVRNSMFSVQEYREDSAPRMFLFEKDTSGAMDTNFVFPSYISNVEDFSLTMLAVQDWMFGGRAAEGGCDVQSINGLSRFTTMDAIRPWGEEQEKLLESGSIAVEGTNLCPPISSRASSLNLCYAGILGVDVSFPGGSIGSYGHSALMHQGVNLQFDAKGEPSMCSISSPNIRGDLSKYSCGEYSLTEFAEARLHGVKIEYDPVSRVATVLEGGEAAVKKAFEAVKRNKDGVGTRPKKKEVQEKKDDWMKDDGMVSLFGDDEELI